jgi:hypothetical protein
VKYAIAKKLKAEHAARYDGIPRVVIEAIAHDVLAYLGQHVDNSVTVELLDDLTMCERCEDWFLGETMVTTVSEDDDSMAFCKPCFEELKTVGGL